MSDPKKHIDESETPLPSPEVPAEEEQAKDKQPDAGDYVFRIRPVNPKNSFDFEDVADK